MVEQSRSRFVATKLIRLAAVLFAVTTIVFFAMRAAPVDATRMILGTAWNPTAAQAVRERLGLNEPLYSQYARFLWDLLQGNLGNSYINAAPVSEQIAQAFPFSIELALVAFAISTVIALPVGIVSAVTPRESKRDIAIRVIVLGGASAPIFFAGAMLIFVFSVQFRLLPSGGAGSFRNLVLPAVTLSLFSTPGLIRITRGTMVETLTKDFILSMRAYGIKERTIVFRRALKNALNPIITLQGLYLGSMIGGSVITESVFSWPGLGRLTINSVLAFDIPMIQGCILTIAAVFLIINSALDLIYGYVDPRARTSED
jgi:peptide/nickel transport system permease protein